MTNRKKEKNKEKIERFTSSKNYRKIRERKKRKRKMYIERGGMKVGLVKQERKN